MPRIEALPVLVWAIVGFAGWRSAALLHAWQHSPLDRLGWLAFGVWCIPAAAYLIPRALPENQPSRTPLLGASLLATLGGTVGDLNAANYLGLALALAAIPGLSWQTTLWLGTALSWMPALSWLAQGTPRPVLIAGRILLAIIGVALALAPWPTTRHPRAAEFAESQEPSPSHGT